MSDTFTEYPGNKVYFAANGHQMEVSPQQSRHSGEWFYVYAFAGHSDECPCWESEEGPEPLEAYAGERWDEDY